ncbi:MAG: nitrous oxide reductase family maturation protein NosD [Saprospiraceae bacterium]|nr:nitrous oxide reductase family maturation protein NosD [Saprospiraceae bacterium]
MPIKVFAFSVLLFFITLNFIHARCIHVGPQQEFRHLREAIYQAKNYDTIKVHHSLYKEGNIVINKKLYLIGIDYPILDGDFTYEVVSIKSDSVTLKGFRIQNSGVASMTEPCGIKIYDAKDVKIEENVLDNNFFAIYVQYGKHIQVKNNTIKAYGSEEQNIGNGIHCWKSDSLQIVHNTIIGQRDGIYFEFVTHSMVYGNISKNNIRYGLHFMFSNDNSYINNFFDSNGAGVAIMYTKNVLIYNNTFSMSVGDASYGILLKELSDVEITGNLFEFNTAALFLEGANRMVVNHNRFYSNGWGLKIQANCVDNVISENNFQNNTFDVSTNGSLVLNKFNANYWDKYEGYDLDHNGSGDVPYRPLSLFSIIIDNNPIAMLLYRSFMVNLLDKTEKLIPSITPEDFRDDQPKLKPYHL